MDRYTETSSQSWFSRLGGAFKGIIVGLVLFVAAFPLLFWNEGRAVERTRTLEEGQGLVESITIDRVDAAKDGSLVHASGLAEPQGELSDPVFGVTARAIALKRSVEMYQWRETRRSEERKQLGGGTETVTTYEYDRVWSSKHENSGSFRHPEGHQNPASMPYQSEVQVSSDVRFGAFKLPGFLSSQISGYRPLTPEYLPQGLVKPVRKDGNGFYLGDNSTSPQIGDLRVRFEAIGPTTISIVAQQQGSSFQPFQTKAGGRIQLLEMGQVDSAGMFQQAHQANTILTWVLRVAGLLAMTIGLNLILRPLSVVADVLPIAGNLVAAGTGIIAFLVALVFSLVTIAFAWIFYRPLLGIALLAAAVGGVWLTRSRVKAAPAPAAPMPPPPPSAA